MESLSPSAVDPAKLAYLVATIVLSLATVETVLHASRLFPVYVIAARS